MGKGEADDLSGIGRIGEDLLIAGHRRVETDLADAFASRAEHPALEHRSIGEDQCAWRKRRRGFCGCGERGVGHRRYRLDLAENRDEIPLGQVALSPIFSFCFKWLAKSSDPASVMVSKFAKWIKIMGLRDEINDSLKEAMKAKDQKRVGTLRLVNAALKDRDIAARTETSRELLGDDEILSLLAKMIKQREDRSEERRVGKECRSRWSAYH